MNNNSTYREILLFTGTQFSSRRYSKIKEEDKGRQLSDHEQLQELSWNGLVPEMLPELFINGGYEKSFVWQVNEADSFIGIEMGATSQPIEMHTSINPYYLFDVISLN